MGIEEQFNGIVEKHFKDIMHNTACCLAEVLFFSMEEKEKFIVDAWKEYGDDIIAYVDGEGSMEEFIALPNNVQELVVIAAIKANFAAIFDKPYDE